MWTLRKDDVEQGEHNLYHTTPPEVADHPMFSKGTVGMVTADNPMHPSHPGGTAAMQKELQGMGLAHELTHGSYGGPKETSFIVHNPTREQMYRLGHKYGQESVIYSQDGKHEMLYTNGPHAGKAHLSKPEMHYSQTQPKDFYTHLPGRGFVTLHFGDEMHDTPIKGTMPLSQMVAQPPLAKRELIQKFAVELHATLKKHLP
jgi:hypothetical protein